MQKINQMPKFLILQSPNKGNIGTITHRDDENFYKPTFYRITDEEIESYTAMSSHAKAAYLAEKLEAQMGTPIQVKKKIAPIAELVESQAEPVSVEMPEVELDVPLNEPANEVIETIEENITESVEEPIEVKPKGRPKKTK